MRASILVATALLLVACGEDEPPTTPAAPATAADPATPASSDPATTATPSAEPSATAPSATTVAEPEVPEDPLPPSPALPDAPAAPTRAHVFVVPELSDEAREAQIDELVGEELEHDGLLFIPADRFLDAEPVTVPVPLPDDAEVELTIEYPSFRHDDARLARLIDERVADFAYAQASRDAPAVTCSGTATGRFVSITCSSSGITERSAFDPETKSIASMLLAIEDGALRPMTLAELFAPGADVAALLSAGCERFVEREELEGEVECPRPQEITTGAALAADGVAVTYASYATMLAMADVFTVPYDELGPHLLARGPLATTLHRARVSTREVEVPAAAPATSAPTRTVWAVAPMASRADLAMTWMGAPAAEREALRLQGGYLVAPDEVRARSVATALGGAARQVSVPRDAGAIALRAMSTTRETPLLRMSHRRGPRARTLPRDARVVAVGDAASGFVRVAAHASAEGFVDARALGPADACAPELAPILESLPEAARADAPSRTMRIVSRPPGARAIHVSELGETMHVEVHRVSDECAMERRVVRFDRPGTTLDHFALTRSERGAGEPLVVTVAGETSSRVLRVHGYRDGREIWSHPLAADERVAVGRREEDRWYPVVVEDADGETLRRAVWAEGALRLATAADTTAPATP